MKYAVAEIKKSKVISPELDTENQAIELMKLIIEEKSKKHPEMSTKYTVIKIPEKTIKKQHIEENKDSIKYVLHQFGISEQFLTDVFGIPYRTVYSWINGHREPPPYVLKLIRTSLKYCLPEQIEIEVK